MKSMLASLAVLSLPLFAAVAGPEPPADLNTPPANAETTTEGLVTKVLRPGNGTVRPSEEKILSMRYTVWRSDGTVVVHVEPPRTVLLPLKNMLPGWRQAAMMMVAGEQRRAWIPSSLGAGKIPEGKSFIIDTELIEIVDPPSAPADVAAPPPGAEVTKSGLASIVLKPGTGMERPGKRSTVMVHYTGWTTDGAMFDSTILKGEPAEFSLDKVIAGWTEGLQLMSEGEKRRFWIPAKLAYGNEKGKPRGMLVFEIELLSILR